jgi:hypothetical protein
MPVRFYLPEDFYNLPLVVNDKRTSFNPHDLAAVHVFLFQYTIEFTDFLILVGQKREFDTLFFPELFVGTDAVSADADDYCFFLFIAVEL